MKYKTAASVVVSLCLLPAHAASAQTASGASAEPITEIRTVLRRSAPGVFASVSRVREIAGGKVVASDLRAGRVRVLDSTLAVLQTPLDSVSVAANAIGQRLVSVFAGQADSTLALDIGGLTMLVLNSSGDIARVTAAPRPQDIGYWVGGPFGTPAVDSRGRFIYRGHARSRKPMLDADTQVMIDADSAPVVRWSASTTMLDTVLFVRVNPTETHLRIGVDGKPSVTIYVNPTPRVDDWVALPEGGFAVVRGRNFQIEWIDADGRQTHTAPIPFDWQRLDEARRQLVRDSAESALAIDRARAAALMGQSVSGSGRSAVASAPQMLLVPADRMGDYLPAFVAGAAIVDDASRVWIRTTAAIGGATVYEVVSRGTWPPRRVLVPPGRMIVGFGRQSRVYLASLDDIGARLEVALIPDLK